MITDALVAEQVDAADLKSVGRKAVPVRFRPSAPFKKAPQRGAFFCYVKKGNTVLQKGILSFADIKKRLVRAFF